ncbi:ferritin-like domain-containing protein [Luteolibacter arcticus]|uniref:Ferritin-like domain-containing protein n=1 Tax=Luteolibacter arcticus TaxID=1581411 RepID=A0ABT3GST0_9BACT|nr:ferritin-like domain-containing protein [Luteolibacter arcticus]MCW1926525.1 ferritin-like domain-containing protein [Luteolibacter arcticus]
MSKLPTLQSLLVQEVKDLYNAETQLVKALPKMAKAATDEGLRDGFKKHLEETKGHVERLEKVAEMLGVSPKGKVCKAMKGLVEEGGEAIEEEGDPAVKDLALIGAAQRVEHYEIAGYGAARALAEALSLENVVELLQATLDEEGATDHALTGLAEQIIPQAARETAHA